MTWKLVVTAAMVSAIALATISTSPDEEARSSHQDASERRFVDAKKPVYELSLQQDTHHAATSRATPFDAAAGANAGSSPVENTLPDAYDLDIPLLTMAFGTDDLDTLINTGKVSLPLPGVQPVELSLVRHTRRHGMDQISALHDGSISTITRRGDSFFATIATATDSYRIEGSSGHSRVFPQRLLAQRTIRHQADFRHVR